MRRLPLIGFVAAIVGLPAMTEAQVSLGLRAGWAFPRGDALDVAGIGNFTEKDLFKGELPIQVDLSFRLAPSLSAGFYYSYAFPSKGTQLKDFCDNIPGASCSNLYDMRFGVQAEYDLSPNEALDPWIAIGTGMEIAHFKVKGFAIPTLGGLVSGDLEGTLRGWEWLNAQIGVDLRSSPGFAIGPYLQYAVGQYTVQDFKLAGQSVAGGGVDNPRTHGWVTVGLRGKFDL